MEHERTGTLRKLEQIMKNIKSNKGFTLIELLVVIALIAVSIGVLGISTASSSSSNLRACTHNFDNLLSRARINSMYRADPVFVEFSVGGGSIWGKYFESDEDGSIRETDALVMGRAGFDVTYTMDGVAGIELPTNTLRISFTRRGELIIVNAEGAQIPGSLTQIRLTNGTTTYVINVTPATGNRQVRIG